MQAWWWRSVAVCALLAAVAGSVAAVATAVDADRAQRATVVAESRVTPAAPTPPAPPAPARVGDSALGASVVLPAGWRRVPDQRLLPVPAGRFPLVVSPNDRAAVLVGTLDPARVGAPVDGARMTAEAGRLVSVFAEGAHPDAARVAALSNAPDTVDGRRAWTALRRTEGAPRPLDGTLVRITAVEAAPRGLVALAVVRPGPTQSADARAADAVVRSLELGAGGPGGRPAELPVLPARAVPPARTVPPRPIPPRPIPPRPIPPRPIPSARTDPPRPIPSARTAPPPPRVTPSAPVPPPRLPVPPPSPSGS